MFTKQTTIFYVQINPSEDGIQGLYVEGELILGGDDYHDEIRKVIPAFIDGLKYCGWEGEVRTFVWEDAGEENLWNGMPTLFEDLPLHKMIENIDYAN